MNPHVAGSTQTDHIENMIEGEITSDQAIENQAEVAADKLQDDMTDEIVSQKTQSAKSKTLERPKEAKSKQVQKTEKGIFTRKETADLADSFNERQGNREYRLPTSSLSKLAQSLGDTITPDTPPEEILLMVQNELTEGKKKPDVAQIDKAFEFLLEVVQIKLERATGLEAVFLEKLQQKVASTKLKHFETFKDKIVAGHNLIEAAYIIKTENKSTSEELDDLRNLSDINNKMDIFKLYAFYKNKGYNHKEIIKEFKKLFQLMGMLVKKKLENPHLQQLLEEIRVLQSILGVFKQADRETRSIIVYLDKVLGLFSKKHSG